MEERTNQVEQFFYDNKIVKAFAIAAVIWGIVGMLVGLTIALQLVFPELNFSTSWLTYGRLRPLAYQCGDFCLCG
jgi:cytochrome c oxidase cbb3-type subunit I/II